MGWVTVTAGARAGTVLWGGLSEGLDHAWPWDMLRQSALRNADVDGYNAVNVLKQKIYNRPVSPARRGPSNSFLRTTICSVLPRKTVGQRRDKHGKAMDLQ